MAQSGVPPGRDSEKKPRGKRRASLVRIGHGGRMDARGIAPDDLGAASDSEWATIIMSSADTNPEYGGEYSNLQQVKHALIRNYLNGWFPKMALGPGGCPRLRYIDTHAGRGKYLN